MLLQHQQQQNGINTVQQYIGEVMQAGVEPEKLHIQHMREPGQRMPVGGVLTGKGGYNTGAAQPTGNNGVIVNVLVIVVDRKPKPRSLPIDCDDGNEEKQTG